MLEVAIVDDEAPARTRLRRLLAAHADVHVAGEADGVGDALALVRTVHPALLFLDIRLGRDDAFALLRRLPEPQPLVIFATAYQQHAVRAFEVAAVDYLLKPFDDERLGAALQRARQRLAMPDAPLAEEDLRRLRTAWGTQAPLRQVVVRDRGERTIVPMDEVIRVAACGNYVELYTAARRYLLRMPLSRLAQRLDPALFLRIHRGHLVRADQIQRLQARAHGDADLHLRDGTVLLLSRRYRSVLPKALRV